MNSETLILTIISIVSSVISLLLAYFLVSMPSENNKSNKIFALFLILGALDISGFYADIFSVIPTNMDMFRSFSCFLLAPVFYLYVLSVCYSNFKLKPIYVLHSLPFFISNLIMLAPYYLKDTAGKIEFYTYYTSHVEVQFAHVLLHLQFIIYLILIFKVLFHFKKIYYENYSNAEIGTYKWLLQLTLVVSFSFVIALIKNIFKFTNYADTFVWLQICTIIISLSLNSWYVLKALKYPELFRSVSSDLQLVNDIEKPNAINDFHERIAFLKVFMTKNEPYLDPSLTLQKLSGQIQIPSRELSILINQHIGRHFFDFVNEYRIEKTTEILKDNSKNKLTILEILYEVGFNSKSSFNTAFKKHKGVTPTEYRKKHL